VNARQPRRRRWLLLLPLIAIIVGAALILGYRGLRGAAGAIIRRPANDALLRWFADPASRAALATSFAAPCPGYPFLTPSAGLVGGLPWNAAYAPYTIFSPHPGVDIFGDGPDGTVPVYAVYDGLLTREEGWKSAVIIRHADPLQPGRIIWTYYTHMASADGARSYIVDRFPPGAAEVPVRQGELIGYQGSYNGGPGAAAIGMHLHFSIVHSDASGRYLNESVFANTLDPTPYLGLKLNDPPSADFPLRCLPPPGAESPASQGTHGKGATPPAGRL